MSVLGLEVSPLLCLCLSCHFLCFIFSPHFTECVHSGPHASLGWTTVQWCRLGVYVGGGGLSLFLHCRLGPTCVSGNFSELSISLCSRLRNIGTTLHSLSLKRWTLICSCLWLAFNNSMWWPQEDFQLLLLVSCTTLSSCQEVPKKVEPYPVHTGSRPAKSLSDLLMLVKFLSDYIVYLSGKRTRKGQVQKSRTVKLQNHVML